MFSNDSLKYPDNVELVPTDHGGHVGFVGKKGNDPDMRWLDWRIVEIVTGGSDFITKPYESFFWIVETDSFI